MKHVEGKVENVYRQNWAKSKKTNILGNYWIFYSIYEKSGNVETSQLVIVSTCYSLLYGFLCSDSQTRPQNQ